MIRVLVLAFTFGRSPSATGGHGWLGADKAKHLAIGTFVQSVGYGTVRVLGGTNGSALAVATAGSATVAALKESRDRRGSGTPEAADVVWTLAGAAAVSPLLAQTRR